MRSTVDPSLVVQGGIELLSPLDVERIYGIPTNTQAIWRSSNRYGFAELVIKLGRSVRYRPRTFEAWLESRRRAT